MNEQLHYPLLEVKGLECIRNHRRLFHALDFIAPVGKITVIKGKNGAGKSSLLKMLAGFLTYNMSGDILYRGSPLSQVEMDDLHDTLLFIGHESYLSYYLTVRENMLFLMNLAGVRLASYSEIEQVLTRLDLLDYHDELVGLLSEGQKRKIALSRLWLAKQPLWILDEPFSSLDHHSVLEMEKLFTTHVEKKGAIILTSHQYFNLIPADLIHEIDLDEYS